MTNCASRAVRTVFLLVLLVTVLADYSWAGHYRNFRVAVYIPISVVEKMRDPQWLQTSWDTLNSQVGIDTVYIETYRSGHFADDQLIENVKKFFRDHGVQIAGGIAYTKDEGHQFQSFCYTDANDRAYVKKVAEFTARHFDDIILDDFFFVMTKTDSDIAAKGNKSWSDFRLALMDGVARDLVIGPAKAVNPKARILIKYPNWYEHFQGLGYDLDKEAKMFDGIYTGTETRDPVVTDQQLQQYESYEIFRYFENIRPGKNGGGWVDTFDVRYIDRYAEQLWETMFAKAPEIMLFNWDLLLGKIEPGDRSAWQGMHTSLDYAQMMTSYYAPAGASGPTMALVAGYSLGQVDKLIGELGEPIGIESYKPYQSTGEDFLHNYLGMIGIPIDLRPEFPSEAQTVLLTESAKFDPRIVAKIKSQLAAGKNVVITSGLLHALQGKGIEDIAEVRYTDHKVLLHQYFAGFGAGAGAPLGSGAIPDVLFPEIKFLTNDAWPVVRGVANDNGFPIVLMDRYSNGTLYVLSVPENFGDLYNLPPEVLSAIKDYVMGTFPVRLNGPSKVSLFAYDKGRFVAESFLDQPATVTVSTTGDAGKLTNLATGEQISGESVATGPSSRAPSAYKRSFRITIPPHSYAAFGFTK